MRSNQFGSIPLSGVSGSLISRANRKYDTSRKRLFDWGAGFEGRVNAGKKAEFLLIEAYGKIRLGIFEAKAGRTKDVVGLVDTSLSSGSIALSGNALGIPKVDVSIPEFYNVPILGKLFSFKGNFAHGWIGNVPLHFSTTNINQAKTYFHQSSFYGRLGKPEWKFKLFGGITHQVFWGSDSSIFGSQFPHSDWHAFPYVITGKKYHGARSISKVGNHLGSIDLGFEWNTNRLKVFVYRQHFYDKGGIWYKANLTDGLLGISIENKNKEPRKAKWRKFLFELLHSKDQAADEWTPSGPEYYYNHEVYKEGYSYKKLSLGTPFFSTKEYTKDDLPHNKRDYFVNNRVLLLHFGTEASVLNWDLIGKLSFSKNYGTYGTSSARTLYTVNGRPYQHIPSYGVFPETNQISTYVEARKQIKKDLQFGCIASFDVGELYNNTAGLVIKLTRAF
jgi:hypothetical protein